MTITAFLSPLLSLLSSLPVIVAAKEALVRTLRPDYESKKAMDVELAGMVMLMEFAIVFGVISPLVVPLVCVALASHLAAFRFACEHQGMSVKYEARPAFAYLLVSLCLGNGLLVWFFIDNRSMIQGSLVVAIGVPVCGIIGLCSGIAWEHRSASTDTVMQLKVLRTGTLGDPLIDPAQSCLEVSDDEEEEHPTLRP